MRTIPDVKLLLYNKCRIFLQNCGFIVDFRPKMTKIIENHTILFVM